MSLICAVCRRPPEEIPEYVDGAKYDAPAVLRATTETCTPEEYVLWNEGTVNAEKDAFYCTTCYIKVGRPLTHPNYSDRPEYRPARR